MPSRLNAEESMKVIDRYLLPSAGERVARSSAATGQTRAEALHGGRELPPAKALPAFYTRARDGPSPYDPHKGAYQRSVDEVWNDQVRFELGLVNSESGDVHWHVDGADGGLKSIEAVKQLKTRRADDYLVTSETLQAPTMVLVATENQGANAVGTGPCTAPARDESTCVNVSAGTSHVKGSDTVSSQHRALFDEVWVTNPQRDRLALESQVGNARAAGLARELESNRSKLYNKCVRTHPHGAFGIRESPYGPNTGSVYAAHRQQLLRDAQKEGRAVRRMDVPRPVDSVFGTCVYSGAEPVHGPRTGNAPADHLFGGVMRQQEPELPKPYGNASSLFYSP